MKHVSGSGLDPKWVDGEIGGYTSYMTSHQETNAAVYSASHDNDDVLLTLPNSCNQLVVVLRDQCVLHFVKYISAMAPGSRWDFDGEFQLEEEAEE
jgi:hypothetical protein